MGAKSGKIWKGLWFKEVIDLYKRRKGDTHYPVPGNFTSAKELDKTSGVPKLTKVSYLRALKSGCGSRIKFAASTGLYNKACALKSLVYCCEADASKMRNADWRVVASKPATVFTVRLSPSGRCYWSDPFQTSPVVFSNSVKLLTFG